jgi:DNA-binding response OmpR family regulator
VLVEVLLIEDDDAIGDGLVRVLTEHGFETHRLKTGRRAVGAVKPATGIVLLDLGLPDIDGISVCRELRRARPDLAILILTARDREIDVVAGLDAGADDYLTKPFRLAELLARVRAHARRIEAAESAPSGQIRVGDMVLDVEARRATVGGTELDLRPKEFDLLALLAHEAGRVVTRERIMAEVWDTNWFGSTKTLDMHVSSLRRQLPDGAITTLRGIGYRFEGS